jgi:hypothetical protein
VLVIRPAIAHKALPFARDVRPQMFRSAHRCRETKIFPRKDTLIAFVGQPHRIDDRGSQVRKWLADYPIDHFGVETLIWLKREIENYLTRAQVIGAGGRRSRRKARPNSCGRTASATALIRSESPQKQHDRGESAGVDLNPTKPFRLIPPSAASGAFARSPPLPRCDRQSPAHPHPADRRCCPRCSPPGTRSGAAGTR